MEKNHFDVLIVGGGISGAALLYELATYTDLKRIGLVEKYDRLASLNTAATSNSQTIHCGDIETNYTLDKARNTKRSAGMVVQYCLKHKYQDKFMLSHQKMALGIGDQEVDFLQRRHAEFTTLFPYLEVFDKKKLKEIEPAVVLDKDGRERPENIIGVGARGQYTTVDYGEMARSLVANAQAHPGIETEVLLNAKVTGLEKRGKVFHVTTPQGTYTADFVVVNAGAHSLFLAHRMGYGLDYGCLPVAGSFYLTTRKILNGKVYMVQNPKLPFAALHGDPDVVKGGITRLGPTALLMPKLERYTGQGGFFEFARTLRMDGAVAKTLLDLFADAEIRNYILRNFIFEIPWFNRRLFLRDAQKLIPSLALADLEYAKGFGGIRPQIIDKKARKLMLGEASIDTREGIIFNMTPSPGATSGLGNAERDVRRIAQHLGCRFDEQLFNQELVIQD